MAFLYDFYFGERSWTPWRLEIGTGAWLHSRLK